MDASVYTGTGDPLFLVRRVPSLHYFGRAAKIIDVDLCYTNAEHYSVIR